MSVEQRYQNLVQQANRDVDALSKSLRSATTKVHPILIERLSQHFELYNRHESIQGNTFTYTKHVDGIRGNQFCNFFLQPFYDQESKPGETAVIEIKLSSKTIESEASRNTMRQAIVQLIDKASPVSRNHIVSLTEILHGLIPETVYQDLIFSFKESKLSVAILGFLERNNYTFPTHDRVVIPGRLENDLNPTLTLNVKYYPGRDDNRAYCQDTDVIRNLVGCCLHSLMSPRPKSRRYKLEYSRYLRVDDRDILRLLVPYQNGQYSHVLLLGDISNFSGSLGNSWLMLFAIALELSTGSLRGKRNVFRCEGRTFTASWFELVALYLYTTVGARVWIEARNEFGFLPGGYLGVACNMTLSLLCFCVLLKDLSVRLRPLVLHFECQLGGDDFAISLVTSVNNRDKVIKVIRTQISNHVGPFKEFQVFDLDNMPDGSIDGATFCKKGVVVNRQDDGIHLESVATLPLPACLSPVEWSSPLYKRVRMWYDLDRTYTHFSQKHPESIGYCDALRCLFLENNPEIEPRFTVTTRLWSNSEKLVEQEGFFLTKRAVEALHELPVQFGANELLFVTFESRLSHLMSLQVIKKMVILVSGLETTIFMLRQGEEHLVTTRVESRERILRPDRELLSRLRTIRNSI